MVTGPSSTAQACWFLVFPDTDAVAALAARARPCATREIAHPSGRPWLIGRWPDHALTSVVCGPARLAVLGLRRTAQGWAVAATAQGWAVAA